MKYFIALDTKEYNLDKDTVPVNLTWEDGLEKWFETVSALDIKDDDIVVGHSLGATIAYLTIKKGSLILYSPSPLFKEAKHLFSEKSVKELGSDYDKIDNYSIKDIKTKPVVYVGELELDVMKETAKMISDDAVIVKGKDHGDIISS
jgi:hypothetical protein